MQEIKAEVLVIGSGAAGAKAAIEAQSAGSDVLLITKGHVGTSGNTVRAGSGIQAPLGHMDPADNPDVYLRDVVKAGAFLNNQKLVERLVNLSMTQIPMMEAWGAKFQKQNGKFIQYQLPGSSYPRSLQPVGYPGGIHWTKAFRTQFKRLNTKVMPEVFITRLLVTNGEVAGAFGISLRNGEPITFRSKVTILATGGCSQIYRKTGTWIGTTGDGIVLAYDAGAELMDMEFHQFFPFYCYTPPFEMKIQTAGFYYYLNAKFYNSLGEEFLERYLPPGKDRRLRDAISRAIYLENKHERGSPHGGAYLAVNHLPDNILDQWMRNRGGAFLRNLERAGIDIHRQALEVGPGSHYTMGGVRVDDNCKSTIPRLYAIGEVASGMDGAERIDGGAITWCLTMGHIAGRQAARTIRELDWLMLDEGQIDAQEQKISSLLDQKQGVTGFEIKSRIKDIMWEHCALVRDQGGLKKGLCLVQKIKNNDLPRMSLF